MKRKILSLLLVLTLVISVFTACGKTPSANNNSSNVSDEDNNDNNDTNEENDLTPEDL